MTAIHTLRSTDGFTFSVHHEVPSKRARGGVVLLPEVFGLTDYIKSIAKEYAAEGYEVVIPALLDRGQRDLVLGYDAPGIARGHGLAYHLGNEKPLLDIAAAVKYFGGKPVGVVGYGWGGSMAYLAGCHVKNIACVVAYYGNDIASFSDAGIQVPTLLNFAQRDHNVPSSDVEYIRHRNPQAAIEVYPGRAGFAAHDRKNLYDVACTQQARAKTMAFLREHLGKATGSPRAKAG